MAYFDFRKLGPTRYGYGKTLRDENIASMRAGARDVGGEAFGRMMRRLGVANTGAAGVMRAAPAAGRAQAQAFRNALLPYIVGEHQFAEGQRQFNKKLALNKYMFDESQPGMLDIFAAILGAGSTVAARRV